MLDIDLPWQAVLILSFGACTAYAISLIVYRLLFSPYAKYPGPKLAGATLWYEVYFNCIKGGGGVYFKEIDRLHTIYGMSHKQILATSHNNSDSFPRSCRTRWTVGNTHQGLFILRDLLPSQA